MQLNSFCMCCQIKKQEAKIRGFKDEKKKADYMKEIMRLFVEAGEDDCSPSLSIEFNELFTKYWGIPQDDYTDIKREFNQLMLDLEENLETVIRKSQDPLSAALLYARTGNYIDFAAMSGVTKEQMLSMLENENKEPLDAKEYQNFREELSRAKSLVYLADNCGEIVLDKIAIKILKERYPNLTITAVVRGKPFVNDATMDDARMCKLTEVVPVIGNGSGVGGTWLKGINEETRTLLYGADIIFSKGQGNFETLHGCGLNIYYLFLCKCDWFLTLFHARKFQGMFINERRTSPPALKALTD